MSSKRLGLCFWTRHRLAIHFISAPTSPTELLKTFADNVSTPALQTIVQKVGFRKVEIKNGNITVNGKLIMLRQVKRHDHHPRFGRAVPLSFISEDLLLVKRYNVNALRRAHYPSHPKLLDLCDELGLWVMHEADLECHGFYDAVAPL
ncbi:glycosyl hydrolases family 2, TIM barrel domain-containing protein [Lipomyces doorenjongii]